MSQNINPDYHNVQVWLQEPPNTTSVLDFVPSEHIRRLRTCFDIAKLQASLGDVLQRRTIQGDHQDHGFGTIALTRRPAGETTSSNDLSGRYYLRTNYDLRETAREELVDEAAFSEFAPDLRDTYFYEVYQNLSKIFVLGRMRILQKSLYNCNSWHRDPEPRLHIPIISNPGSLFIINHHCTHLPADGSVYFTDTRGYHTALNGGEQPRTHIVAALVGVRP